MLKPALTGSTKRLRKMTKRSLWTIGSKPIARAPGPGAAWPQSQGFGRRSCGRQYPGSRHLDAATKAAQVALEANDLDTAIREIKLAIAVAPGKLKTWLDDFLVQLENDRRRLPEANHREDVAESATAELQQRLPEADHDEIHRGEVAESATVKLQQRLPEANHGEVHRGQATENATAKHQQRLPEAKHGEIHREVAESTANHPEEVDESALPPNLEYELTSWGFTPFLGVSSGLRTTRAKRTTDSAVFN